MMNLAPSADQAQIASMADEFLTKQLPISRVRALMDDPDGDALDEQTWLHCAELGWLGLSVSEDHGGVGLGVPEEVMLFRELGRGLAPGPFRSSVLGTRVAALAGETELARAIIAGNLRVGFRPGLQVSDLAIDVRPGDLVLHLDAAQGELFEVLTVDRVAGIDPCTRFGRATTGRLRARVEDTTLIDRARVLAAAELLGMIEAIRDMAAVHAQTRIQFDKAIGSFQAVKHRCADMAVAAYATVGQVFQAALLVEAATADAGFHAAAAYVLAVNGARVSAADNIQNLGGIGYSWEHDAHLYLKRAFLLEHLLGPQRESYRTVLGPQRHEF